MADQSDLMNAFQMFQSGVQQAATASAVNDATAEMDRIKQGALDAGQQRQALRGLSDQMALKLTALGTPASTIQQAFQAIAPQTFGSVEQMQLEGQLSGSKQLNDVASNILGDREQAKRGEMQFANKLAMERDAAQFAREKELALLKAGAKPEGKVFGFDKVDPEVQLTPKEVAGLRAGVGTLKDVAGTVKELDSLVEEHGTDWINVPFGNKIKDRMETNYSGLILKLKELEKLGVLQKLDVDALEAVVPNPGSMINTATYTAKMGEFKKDLARRLQTSAATGGFKVSDKLASSIGLEKEFGILPKRVAAKLGPEMQKKYELAREWADRDPEAAAFMKQVQEGVYGK